MFIKQNCAQLCHIKSLLHISFEQGNVVPLYYYIYLIFFRRLTMFKKLGISVLLCSVAIGLAACGQQGSSSQGGSQTATSSAPASNTAASTATSQNNAASTTSGKASSTSPTSSSSANSSSSNSSSSNGSSS